MIKHVDLYTVSILGEAFTLKSDEGEESVRLLASRVEELLQEVAVKTGSADMRRVAILALLKVVHNLHELEANLQKKNGDESALVNYINQQLSSFSDL